MTRQIQDAYIVAAVRTAVGKAPRGRFRQVRPDYLLAHVLRGAIAKVPGHDPHDIAKEGGFISEHDDEIGSRIATVICGGEVEPGSAVDEKWLLDLERHHFVELAKMAKTQERIEHMLKTGKPLRN